MAPVANSADGLGEKLPEGGNYWWPFGYNAEETASDKSIYKELPKAKLGFSVASSLFDLKEGDRTITLKIDLIKFNQKLKKLEKEDFRTISKYFAAGKKNGYPTLHYNVLKMEK
jgi:hypothetical protein